MKANRKQTAVKLTASKINPDVMVRVVTENGQYCLHQVVTIDLVFTTNNNLT